MFYTYVLNCTFQQKQEFYVGYCSNLKIRLSQHINRKVITTKKFDKIDLIYFEACLNKTDARKRELQFKTGFGRGYLKRRLLNYLKLRV